MLKMEITSRKPKQELQTTNYQSQTTSSNPRVPTLKLNCSKIKIQKNKNLNYLSSRIS